MDITVSYFTEVARPRRTLDEVVSLLYYLGEDVLQYSVIPSTQNLIIEMSLDASKVRLTDTDANSMAKEVHTFIRRTVPFMYGPGFMDALDSMASYFRFFAIYVLLLLDSEFSMSVSMVDFLKFIRALNRFVENSHFDMYMNPWSGVRSVDPFRQIYRNASGQIDWTMYHLCGVLCGKIRLMGKLCHFTEGKLQMHGPFERDFHTISLFVPHFGFHWESSPYDAYPFSNGAPLNGVWTSESVLLGDIPIGPPFNIPSDTVVSGKSTMVELYQWLPCYRHRRQRIQDLTQNDLMDVVSQLKELYTTFGGAGLKYMFEGLPIYVQRLFRNDLHRWARYDLYDLSIRLMEQFFPIMRKLKVMDAKFETLQTLPIIIQMGWTQVVAKAQGGVKILNDAVGFATGGSPDLKEEQRLRVDIWRAFDDPLVESLRNKGAFAYDKKINQFIIPTRNYIRNFMAAHRRKFNMPVQLQKYHPQGTPFPPGNVTIAEKASMAIIQLYIRLFGWDRNPDYSELAFYLLACHPDYPADNFDQLYENYPLGVQKMTNLMIYIVNEIDKMLGGNGHDIFVFPRGVPSSLLHSLIILYNGLVDIFNDPATNTTTLPYTHFPVFDPAAFGRYSIERVIAMDYFGRFANIHPSVIQGEYHPLLLTQEEGRRE